VRYFADHVAPTRRFRAASPHEAAALADLKGRLESWTGGADPEEIQNMIYQVGKDHGFEPLKDWFTALYEVLLGASQGPRFGGFVALYGVAETSALIGQALDGALLPPPEVADARDM
jgi:lysyl-tRNA synthetase class 1